MDKHLRPSRFECEPNAIDAEKQWRHWFRTFENFMGSLSFPDTMGDAIIQQHKLSTLINYVSPSIYDFISESTSFNDAVNTLKDLYVKPVNVMYNRHVLMTHRQSETQPVDQYLQELERLSRNCNFTNVSAENYRKEYVRDAFINGLRSPSIRQRLLENHTLTLQQAFEQARTLELAHKHSASFQSPTIHPEGNQKQKCYFCGNDRHPRSKCPARDSICNKCSKKDTGREFVVL